MEIKLHSTTLGDTVVMAISHSPIEPQRRDWLTLSSSASSWKLCWHEYLSEEENMPCLDKVVGIDSLPHKKEDATQKGVELSPRKWLNTRVADRAQGLVG